MIFINFFKIPWYFQVFQVYPHFSRFYRSSGNPELFPKLIFLILVSCEFIRLDFNNYWPQRSWSKVMFLQASVILSTGGICLSACWDTPPPLGPDTPPRPDTPRKQTPAYGQRAAGTHPTGMHSCLWFNLIFGLHIVSITRNFNLSTKNSRFQNNGSKYDTN